MPTGQPQDPAPRDADRRREADDFAAPSESGGFVADPDDPDLNPDVERASEIDDVTGPVSVVSADTASDADEVPGEGNGDSGSDSAGSDPDAPVTITAGDLNALRTERDEYRAMAQRLQAEFDNFRRRSAAQSQAEIDRAGGRLIEALLPVLDAAEAAYVEHPDEIGPLLNAMLGELRKHGLETVDLEGQPFDPEVAEAVAHESGGGSDVIVAEVLRSGYRWKDKTLRPAMVRTKD